MVCRDFIVLNVETVFQLHHTQHKFKKGHPGLNDNLKKHK